MPEMNQPLPPADPAPIKVLPAMGRGFLGRCPACNRGRLFGRFLKVRTIATPAGRNSTITGPTTCRPIW